MILPGETEAGLGRDATMLRVSLVGSLSRWLTVQEFVLWHRTRPAQSSDDRPPCLENPRPAGSESALTENVASPFQAEPAQIVLTYSRV
jgi:hypothetical protein